MASEPARRPAGRLSPEAAGACLSELFERHGRMVYGVCRLMLRDGSEAEDAAQQTFLSAYRSMLAGHEPREPAAWLATIARNECRARIRERMSSPLVLLDDSAATAPDVEQVSGRREEIAVLCEALAELPRHQREAIVLREFYGLSHEEVGLALGVSSSAVDGLLVRARRRLQAELRPSRIASGAIAVPLALRDSLAQALPSFASASAASGAAAGSGALAKILSLPVAAKLAAGTVAVVAVAGSLTAVEVSRDDVVSPVPAPALAAPDPVAAARAPAREARAPQTLELELNAGSAGSLAAEDEELEESDDEAGEMDDADEPEAEEREDGEDAEEAEEAQETEDVEREDAEEAESESESEASEPGD